SHVHRARRTRGRQPAARRHHELAADRGRQDAADRVHLHGAASCTRERPHHRGDRRILRPAAHARHVRRRHHEVTMIGKTHWAIAEGYIPPYSSSETRELTSHETACILNANEQDAHVTVMVYFANRDPAGPYQVTV